MSSPSQLLPLKITKQLQVFMLCLIVVVSAFLIAGISALQSITYPMAAFLVVTCVHFWLAVILFSLLLSFFSKKIKAVVESDLSDIHAAETWANEYLITGEETPFSGDNSIAVAVNLLQKQLNEAKQSDSRFDQLLREQALLDRATGIGNRQFLSNRLDALLAEDDAYGAVLLVHMQDAELIQNLYGKTAAINLLSNIIKGIKCRLSHLPNYFIARQGEAELAILIPSLYAAETEKLAGRILKNLQTIAVPVGINPEEFIHIGVTCFSKTHSSYQIMAEADMALRSAQLQGPSQWFMFENGEVVSQTAKGSLKWRTFLQKAIDKNTFVLFFQPVVAAQSSQPLHHEVLAKVRDEFGVLINARVFLPMAKKCGLSVRIDQLVFEQVCRLLQYEKNCADNCSLNLSIDALLSVDFQGYFIDVLITSPLVAKRLIIEISEYQLVSHLNELMPFIERMHQVGVRLLVDKVGQYVVNAQYLKTCPFSFVKLDRSIVLNINKKPENQLFIQSLKVMCQYQNIAIYALGVEMEAEWQMLKTLGIDGGQGHYFTKPLKSIVTEKQLSH